MARFLRHLKEIKPKLSRFLSMPSTSYPVDHIDVTDFKLSSKYLQEAKLEVLRKYNLNVLNDRLTQALDYNLLKGKQVGQRVLIPTHKELFQCQDLDLEKQKLFHIMGWCMELMIYSLIVRDDLTDNSLTRFGHKCWYKMESIGLSAVNDAFIFENMIFFLLHKHFKHLECYTKLIELSHETTMAIACGQCLDMMYSNASVLSFNRDNYKALVTAKTGFGGFYYPYVMVMHLAGIKDPEALAQAKRISLKIGQLYQAQNDFLDCFGYFSITGKRCTDIQGHKCSWLSVECMERASSEEKQIMLECYGQKDPEKVQRIMDLYIHLDLPKIYKDFEMESVETIKYELQQTSAGVPRKSMLSILDEIIRKKVLV
ncbi:farnesyl pyrophosphate synthase-like [Haematobia irritans]|uniref:farnesyl pyrophosphate synthase-like n=1 Tax=Haematobia irritans TaxID=7368 RepID=UPI003F508902